MIEALLADAKRKSYILGIDGGDEGERYGCMVAPNRGSLSSGYDVDPAEAIQRALFDSLVQSTDSQLQKMARRVNLRVSRNASGLFECSDVEFGLQAEGATRAEAKGKVRTLLGLHLGKLLESRLSPEEVRASMPVSAVATERWAAVFRENTGAHQGVTLRFDASTGVWVCGEPGARRPSTDPSPYIAAANALYRQRSLIIAVRNHLRSQTSE